jgi:hypothetical protein
MNTIAKYTEKPRIKKKTTNVLPYFQVFFE